MAVQYCNYDIKGTLAVTGDATMGGALNVTEYIFRTGQGSNYHRFLNARQIFVVGNATSIDLNNGVSTFGATGGATTLQGTSLVLDSSGDITLDADGGDILFKDAGTLVGTIGNFSSSNFQIKSEVSNKDIVFKGNDGGSEIISLTLDMSDNGWAYFNSGIQIEAGLYIPSYIYHNGDTGTYFGFEGNDSWRVVTNSSERISVNNSGLRIGNGARVTTTLDEDNMASNSATALATQQSIKAYVDTSVSGVSSGVTSVATTNGITGGTITSTGTIQVDSTVVRTTGAQTIANLKTFTERTDFTNAAGIRTNQVRTQNGQQLVLNGGEAGTYATGQTNELVYLNAESGIQINSSPDNWSSGWAGRKTTTINDTSGNSTFANDITVSGGDITLGGTGRIQGVDTVSASTDAANKAYVDAHVSPAGTYLPLIGGTMSGNIVMGDNDITGIDQLIFTSGTYLSDVSSNYLELRYASATAGGIIVMDGDGTTQGYLYADGATTSSFGLLDGSGSWAVRCLEDAYVELRYDNSAKLQTLTDGVYVDGKLGIGTSTPDTDGYSYFEDLVIKAGASSADGAGITIDSSSRQYGGIAFKDSTGFQGEIFYDHTNEGMNFKVGSLNKFSIGTSSATVVGDLNVNGGDIILGGTGRIQGVDTVSASTDATSKTYVDNAINTAVTGVLKYDGVWNASTNSPTLSSGSGTVGEYYIVSVAGSTNLDGITDWAVGDWAVFSDQTTDAWQKIDNTQVGNVTGSGSSGRVAYWNSASNITSDSAFTFDQSSNNLTVGGSVTWSGGSSAESNSAYDNMITAFSDSGSSTITLTLTQQDGGTLTTSFSNPQGTVTKSGTPVNNQLAVWTSATNIEGESELTYDGATFNVGGSANTSTFLDVVGTNTAGAPATSAAIRIYGYEGRAEGIFYYDTAYSNDEWYSGLPYSGGSTYQIGFDTSGGQAQYVANSVLSISSSGQVTFNKYGTSSPFTGTLTNFPAFAGNGKIIERTPAQVLSDIGGAPATGGAYLPLVGGTLTGPLTVGASTDGHDVFFYGDAAGEGMLWDESESRLQINHDTNDSGLDVFTVSSAAMNQPQLRVGRNTAEFWGVYTGDRDAHLVHRQDETTGTMSTKFDQWDSNTSDTLGFWAWRSGNGSGGSMSTALELKQSGDAIFAGNVVANGTIQTLASNANLTISGDSSGNVYYNNTAGEHRWRANGSSVNSMTLTSSLLTVNENATFTGGEGAVNVNGSGNQSIKVGSTSGGFARIYLDGKNGDFSGSDYIYIGQNDNGAVHFYADTNAGTTVFTSKGATNLTMDGANSTFSGSVTTPSVITPLITTATNTSLFLQPNGSGHLYLGDSTNGTNLYHYSASNDGVYTTYDFNGNYYRISTTATSGVKIDDPLTVSADIILVGTGRIQGVDTVSVGTDAANKDYVDTAVGTVPVGTVTGVSSNTTSQLTVSQSSPAPELSIVTAAVTNGGTGLATGNQIYDWGVAAFAPIVSGGYLPLAGGTMTGDIQFNEHSAKFNESGVRSWDISAFSGNLNITSGDSTGTVFLSPALSVEDNATIGGSLDVNGAVSTFGAAGTGTGDAVVSIDGGSGTGGEAYLRLTRGSTSGFILNHTASALQVRATANIPMLFYTNDTLALTLSTSQHATFAGDLYIPEYIYHSGDTNTYIRFTADTQTFRTGGDDRLTLTNSAATFANDITLGPSSSIVLDDTPTASTASGSGTIVNWSVSETVVAGSLYAVKTNGGWTLADADNENTAAYMLGIALGTNATQGMLLQGFFYKSSHGFTIGAPLYISTTGGTFSNVRPTATNDYVRVIGYATSANYIYFDPDKTWVKID